MNPMGIPLGGIVVTKDVNVGACWPPRVRSRFQTVTFVQGGPQADPYKQGEVEYGAPLKRALSMGKWGYNRYNSSLIVVK